MSNKYVIGRPFVDRAVLTLPEARRFAVDDDGLSTTNRYVIGVTLNGRALTRSYVRDDELRAGDELRCAMGAVPNKPGAAARPRVRSRCRRLNRRAVRPTRSVRAGPR